MRLIKTTLAVWLAALCLQSCSNEETPVLQDTGNKYMAEVTMTATREMFDNTRSSLTESEGKLKFSWNIGDVVYVTSLSDQNGTQSEGYAGKLTVKSISNDGKNAEFTGTVDGLYNGQKSYKFYFFGNTTPKEDVENEISAKSYDFSSHQGLLSTFADNDLQIGVADIKFEKGKGSVNIKFIRQFSCAHYKLVYNGEDLDTKGVKISVSADNLASTADVDFTNATITQGSARVIEITPLESNDFYMTLIPNDAETLLTFTCTVDGVNFKGTRKLSNNAKNKFYRLDAGYGAIPIEMNKVVTNTYNVVYHFLNEAYGGSQEKSFEMASKTYTVTGDEALAYKVLDFSEVDCASVSITPVAKVNSEANGKFSDADIAYFLGWGANETGDNRRAHKGVISYQAGATINVDDVLNGENNSTMHLYAKSGTIEFKLDYDYNDKASELVEYKRPSGASGGYRVLGWFDFDTDHYNGGAYASGAYSKSGHEQIGWTRTKNGEKEFDLKDVLRINKNDDVRTEATPLPTTPGGVVATVTVTLYPVWMKIENETIDITNYGTGTLE